MMDEEIFKMYDVLMKIFDVVRIVDGGGSHEVCVFENGQIIPVKEKCYCFWNRNVKCVNCVSKQACSKKEQMVKLEFVDGKYYFVIAKPFEFHGKQYILELFSNITTKLATSYSESNQSNFVVDLINQIDFISSKDSFTGLFNKNYISSLTNEALLKNKDELYLALIDIDNFKLLNDNYGHTIGDKVIIKLVEITNKCLSEKEGYVGRFGGDEFVVLFNSSDEAKVNGILSSIEKNFELINDIEGLDKKITLTYGYANINKALCFEDAINMADKIMYEKKNFKKVGR